MADQAAPPSGNQPPADFQPFADTVNQPPADFQPFERGEGEVNPPVEGLGARLWQGAKDVATGAVKGLGEDIIDLATTNLGPRTSQGQKNEAWARQYLIPSGNTQSISKGISEVAAPLVVGGAMGPTELIEQPNPLFAKAGVPEITELVEQKGPSIARFVGQKIAGIMKAHPYMSYTMAVHAAREMGIPVPKILDPIAWLASTTLRGAEPGQEPTPIAPIAAPKPVDNQETEPKAMPKLDTEEGKALMDRVRIEDKNLILVPPGPKDKGQSFYKLVNNEFPNWVDTSYANEMNIALRKGIPITDEMKAEILWYAEHEWTDEDIKGKLIDVPGADFGSLSIANKQPTPTPLAQPAPVQAPVQAGGGELPPAMPLIPTATPEQPATTEAFAPEPEAPQPIPMPQQPGPALFPAPKEGAPANVIAPIQAAGKAPAPETPALIGPQAANPVAPKPFENEPLRVAGGQSTTALTQNVASQADVDELRKRVERLAQQLNRAKDSSEDARREWDALVNSGAITVHKGGTFTVNK